jgi:hypothetical protein
MKMSGFADLLQLTFDGPITAVGLPTQILRQML